MDEHRRFRISPPAYAGLGRCDNTPLESRIGHGLLSVDAKICKANNS
jgi:hypothetical protein